MMKASTVIRLNREKLGLTVRELAERVGVSKSAVSKWENGSTDNIKKVNLTRLAEVLNVNPIELLDVANPEKSELVKVPVIGNIACGSPILSDDNIVDFKEVPAQAVPSGTVFYAHAQGDSMEPTIPNGSLVLIRKQPEVEEGQIAAVMIDDEVTLKRFHKQGDIIMLLPDNRKYKPIILDPNSQNKIVGRAVSTSTPL